MLNGMRKLINKIKQKYGLPVVWYRCNIYKTAKIGKNVSIGSDTEVGPGVIIRKNTRIQAKCFIPKGVYIGEDCFIGPGVIFTNDKNPPSGECAATLINDGVSIGANSTILPGIVIDKNVTIGAGSVVTTDLPANTICYGNPARVARIKSAKKS